MPSPFPGMDPYLENPLHWRGVHQRLLGAITETLNQELPSGLYADTEDRVVVTPPPPQRQVVLRTVENNELVTVIEVLSPTNKRFGRDRDEYLAKQAELLASEVHFLEIALLREGTHTVAVAEEDVEPFGEWDYLVCLHYGGTGEEFEFWPVSLRKRLPRIRVPLTAGLPDQVLDLQAVFDHAYDAGPHRRQTDYRQAPVPPLEEPDADWADALLREQGLR